MSVGPDPGSATGDRTGDPLIEVLHIEECPNRVEAGGMIRRALDSLGLDGVEVRYVLLKTGEEAAAVPFAGSPTILVDGADLFPGRRTDDLACRVYRTPRGLAGLPTQDQVDRALADRLRPSA